MTVDAEVGGENVSDDSERPLGPWSGVGAMTPGVVAALGCGVAAMAEGVTTGVAVAGLLALPLGLCSWLTASAREDFPFSSRSAGLVTGTALALVLPVLMVFAALLKANTHHRALAGVTFSVVGLAVVMGALAAGGRVASFAAARSPASARGLSWLVATIAAAVVLGVLARGGLLSPTRLDGVGLIAAIVAGWLVRPANGWGRPAAASAAVGVALTIGAVVLVGSPDVARSVASRGQIAGGIVIELHPEARPPSPPSATSDGHDG